MAETLATITATVAGMLVRTDLDAEIKHEIRAAVAHYARRGGDYLQRGEGTITTTADVQWYATADFSSSFGAETSPSATLSIRDIILLEYIKVTPGSSGFSDPITRIDFSEFEFLSDGADTGQFPEFYTIHAERIGFWPIPAQEMTIELAAMIRPAPVTTDGGTTPFFDRFNELIELSAARRVCQKYIKDYEKAGAYQALEVDVWEGVAKDMIRRIGSGRIKAREY